MKEYELKIKALLEGLEIQNIEKFMREAKVGDYRNLGKAYISAVRGKIKEKAESSSKCEADISDKDEMIVAIAELVIHVYKLALK